MTLFFIYCRRSVRLPAATLYREARPLDSCPDDVQAAASADPGNPFSQTAVATVATPEEIRLSHWTRLREVARWRRWAQYWFIAPLVCIVIAVVVPDRLGFLVNITFWMLLISWVPVWIWLTVKLRRALGSSDSVNDVLDYLLPGYLDLRAHSVLRGAGVEVKLAGRDLPEEPPAWFHP